MLRELSSKTGKGTELVSLYIPPKKALHEVLNSLREEYGTATNIKSDSTRNHVQDALTKTQQRLKLFKKTPENGIVLFVGSLMTNGPGSEQVFVNEIIPPRPVQTYLYRCDDHFHLEHLMDMIKEVDLIGIISIDSTEAGLGVLTGAKLVVDEIITSGVGGKTRAGGQSARRYERLREMNLSGYYNRVAAHAKKLFLEQNKIKGLIISGPGPTKDSFLKSDYLDYRLREKILSEVDGAYSGAEGVREAVDKSSDVLKDMRVIEEKKLIQRFLSEIHKEKSLAAYGIKEVMDATTKGAVEVIIASEDLNMLNILLKCNRCSTDKNKILNRTSYVQDKQKFLSESCESCKASDFTITETDLIEILEDKASETGTKIEVLGSGSEEGRMLMSFSGLGAILRYRMQ
tara:strand:+ start:923 stop:2128 length:1206 start_codon:yes stop_codon:yes gene_type:complete